MKAREKAARAGQSGGPACTWLRPHWVDAAGALTQQGISAGLVETPTPNLHKPKARAKSHPAVQLPLARADGALVFTFLSILYFRGPSVSYARQLPWSLCTKWLPRGLAETSSPFGRQPSGAPAPRCAGVEAHRIAHNKYLYLRSLTQQLY